MRWFIKLKNDLMEKLSFWSETEEKGIHYITNNQTLPAPLTAQEERELIARLAAQDKEAAQALIEHNLRLVIYIARKYENNNVNNTEDLISIGTIGLIKGITTFDASKGARLATYAARCVENAILSQRNNRRLRWKTMNLLGQNGLCSAA